MSDNTLDQPRGRAVACLPDQATAESAAVRIAEHGLGDGLEILHGTRISDDVDTSPKWFADTDLDLAVFKNHLASGGSVVSVPVDADDQLDTVRAVLEEAGATVFTHFGNWVTTTERLDAE